MGFRGGGIALVTFGAAVAFCCKEQRPTQVISSDAGCSGNAGAKREARIPGEPRHSHTAWPCGAWHGVLHSGGTSRA